MSNAQNSNPETLTDRKERRVYPYKGHLLICYGGERYFSPEATALSAEFPVTKVVAENSESAPETIEVTQRRKGKKGVTETWFQLDG
jgi:hypothetical protein